MDTKKRMKLTHSETPAVKAERERREEQDSLWDKVRQSARDILNAERNERWISTGEFIKLLCAESSVSRQIAVSVITELRDNGECIYSLGNGYCKPENATPESKSTPVERPKDVQRRNDFLSFAKMLNEIYAK